MLNKKGNPFIMKFGKYKGQDIEEVFSKDESYLNWLRFTVNPEKNEKLIGKINTLFRKADKKVFYEKYGFSEDEDTDSE